MFGSQHHRAVPRRVWISKRAPQRANFGSAERIRNPGMSHRRCLALLALCSPCNAGGARGKHANGVCYVDLEIVIHTWQNIICLQNIALSVCILRKSLAVYNVHLLRICAPTFICSFVSDYVIFELKYDNASWFPFPPSRTCRDTDPWMTAIKVS